MFDIKVYINGKNTPISAIIDIFDKDTVEFEVCGENIEYFSAENFELFLEDYEVPLVESENGSLIKSQINHLFRESFGYSNIRIFFNDELLSEILFNVSTNEDKFNNIKGMMSYLLKNNERVLDICFSRTKYKAKNTGEHEASFESIISLSEKIINTFDEKNNVLQKELRHRLELVNENASEENYYNINPYDIINNLDQLYQGYSPNYLKIFGKVYSLDNIQRENYIDSYNLLENQILLGGLISIKETMLDILHTMKSKSPDLNYDKEYEIIKPYYKLNNFIIEDLYVHLTTDGMVKRIDSILLNIEGLLYFFRKKLNIDFLGFITPLITPYVKRSSFYLKSYNYLAEWYSLGSPKIGIDANLAKIRSVSKVYELFTLYKLIDALYLDGWEVTKSIEDGYLKRFIPSQVEFQKNETVLTLYYEKKINGFSHLTKHNDLVALNKNNSQSKYNYYKPDFLILKKSADIVSYYILDSKYSSSKTLKDFKVLDILFEKYFINLAAYNDIDKVLEKHNIKCVHAIHPFGNQELTKWSTQLPRITPDISSTLLSQDQNGLGKILSLINESV